MPPLHQSFLGLKFDCVSELAAIDLIVSLSANRKFSYIVTPNVDHVVRLHKFASDPGLWPAYERANLRLCDSRVLAILAKISGIDLTVVPGSDLTALYVQQNQSHSRIAIVGGDEGIKRGLESRFPNHAWYQHIPPMGILGNDVAQRQIIQFVENCPAQVFLFAIGSPQS
jgi:N-acetylglucosaminyldiphosphoundecaprenol N-acetyl-beta-D-mannosaminyltransferase